MNRILLVIMFGVAISGYSQSVEDNILYSPPSPNATGLSKYASVPVSLYTGTPMINLPITELKGRRLSVPISVSYHASGIKVQDVASWVGLGWTLNAGGVITRTVRGLPDEEANGYCGVNNIGEKAQQQVDKEYVSKISQNVWDGEPDLFYYNFLGNVGMFILDDDGIPVSLPHSNIKIEPAICPVGSGKWVLTDANGVRYTFGKDENSKESSTSKITGLTAKTYISSWYLSEIRNTDGETIQFTYISGESFSYKYFVQEDKKKIYNWGIWGSACVTSATSTTDEKNIEITISNPRYLSKIESTQGKVSFISITGRADLPGGRSLKEIKVLDFNDNLVDHYQFDYSYFLSDAECSTEKCRRLKLNGIVQTLDGISNHVYALQYNSTNLPWRDSHQIDHWGFYNSNTYTSKIPAVDDTANPDCGQNHVGAERSADSLKSRANILTRIEFATGGYKQFTYQANLYTDGSGNQQVAGGVRIRVISNCSEGDCYNEYFSYKNFNDPLKSSGSIYSIPKYDFRSIAAISGVSGGSPYSVGSTFFVRRSQSLTDLFDINGSHIGYSNVKTKSLLNGYTLHYYTNLQSHADVAPAQYEYRVMNEENGGSHGEMGDTMPSHAFPYTPSTSKSWERGILTKKEVYSESGKILLSEKYKYKFNMTVVKTVVGVKSAARYSNYFGTYYTVGNYSSVSRPYILEKATITSYDQNASASDTTKRYRVFTDYTFNATTLLPAQVTSYTEAQPGDKTIVKTRFVSDLQFPSYIESCNSNYSACRENCIGGNRDQCLSDCLQQRSTCLSSAPTLSPESAAVLFMMDNNEIGAPVETQTLIEKNSTQKLIGAELYKYRKFGTSLIFVKPTEVWRLKSVVDIVGGNSYVQARVNPTTGIYEIDARARKILSFDSYDPSNGNVTQQSDYKGITQSYSWSTNFNSALMTGLTVNPGSLEHSSQYQYRQLVGVSQITDPNSRNMSYQYDELNRQEVIKDHDGNIVSRKRVKNLKERMDAVIKITGTKAVNSSISFEDVMGSEPRVSTYSWNFGDGSSSSTAKINHTYVNPGSYTVTLTKTNPVYGTASASTIVVILPPPSVVICADGPIQVDLCGTYAVVFGSCTSVNTSNYSETTLIMEVSNGCPPYTYEWSYNQAYAGGGSTGWTSFAGNFSFVTAPFYRNEVSYSVKCRVVDACGNEVTSSEQALVNYKSNSSCTVVY